MTQMPPRVSPALRLALASRYAPQAAATWAAIRPQVHWPALAAEATALGLASLLYDVARDLPAGEASADVLTALRQEYAQAGLLNAYLLPQFATALRALKNAGIEPILLKGTALLAVVYDNPALRPMSDLDLLIPFSALPAAEDCLARVGFLPLQPLPFANESGFFWNERLLQRRGWQPVSVELHWALLDIPYYARRWPEADLRRRSQLAALDGLPVRVLCPEDQLLHLCAHHFYHHQGQLVRVGPDVGHLLRRCAVDWDAFLARATACGLGLAARETLRWCMEAWHAPIPPPHRAAIEGLRAGPLQGWFQRAQRREWLKVARTGLTLPNWRLRLCYTWRQLFPNRAYLLWRYGLPANTPAFRAYLARFRLRVGGS